MRRAYEDWKPRQDALVTIAQAEEIAADYARQGYDLTLRQLHYQFVSRGLGPNTAKAYKRLGEVINRARMAGLFDWNYIVDRTRNLAGLNHWDDPSQIIRASAAQYRIDKWADQDTRVEVWVEKEALAGVVARAANAADVDYFSCRGYVSQSEMHEAGNRLGRYIRNGQKVVVLHLGDHDPSGLDMTRDINDRLHTFIAYDSAYAGRDSSEHHNLEVRRIALNWDQVQEYQPPPNPTKFTDSRAEGYVQEYGDESWELDALDPGVLNDLINSHVEGIIDRDRFAAAQAEEDEQQAALQAIADNYDEIVEQFA